MLSSFRFMRLRGAKGKGPLKEFQGIQGNRAQISGIPCPRRCAGRTPPRKGTRPAPRFGVAAPPSPALDEAMASPRFIHLRTHSEYSLLEGALRLKKLPGLCEKHAMPAVALTDSNNMFAALEFSVAAAGAGVQPIIGCQLDLLYLTPQPGERPKPPAPLVLLAQSERGYENLMKLNSCLYLREDGSAETVAAAAMLAEEDYDDEAEDNINLEDGEDDEYY